MKNLKSLIKVSVMMFTAVMLMTWANDMIFDCVYGLMESTNTVDSPIVLIVLSVMFACTVIEVKRTALAVKFDATKLYKKIEKKIKDLSAKKAAV